MKELFWAIAYEAFYMMHRRCYDLVEPLSKFESREYFVGVESSTCRCEECEVFFDCFKDEVKEEVAIRRDGGTGRH